jgi:hypothetical protein
MISKQSLMKVAHAIRLLDLALYDADGLDRISLKFNFGRSGLIGLIHANGFNMTETYDLEEMTPEERSEYSGLTKE